ncbi:MAG: YlmC/YmxH family sporulation protein [Oscillospiraceae bacterium]|nr:YlmC/YmxH family sporulation protein [Oscillospiraceae bacterium]
MTQRFCVEGCAVVELKFGQLRLKEVIGIGDGSRFGYVGDVELDLDSGQVKALVIPGRLRLFGLLGREEDVIVPWDRVRRFGDDIILVEHIPLHPEKRKKK